MPRHHAIWDAELRQQVDIEFTAEEEIARDIEEAASFEREAIQNAATASRVAAKERAVAKFVALGLTDEEIKAFIG
jgi:hypothetical protein